jgi:arylsulfatase
VSWPAGTESDAQGAVRAQYCHAVDIMPTALECCDVEVPTHLGHVPQMSLDGVSFTHLLAPAGAEAPPPRKTQYYEMWGSRGIYYDGWKAVTDHVNQQHPAERDLMEGSADFHDDQWLLFHVADDFAEVRDLAAERPDKLRLLIERWYFEAGRNGVLPLSDRIHDRLPHMDFRWVVPRRRYDLSPGTAVHEEAGPMLFGNDFSVIAELGEALAADVEGLLCQQGNWTNGWAWYVRDGVLTWVLNYVGASMHFVRTPVPVGSRTLAFSLHGSYSQGRIGRMYGDGVELVATAVAEPIPFRWAANGSFLTVGYGRGFPVCDEYHPPFPFAGPLERLIVLAGEPAPLDPERMRRLLLHHQ